MDLYDIKKYLDPKWKFAVLKLAIDDVNDTPWVFTETEDEAKIRVANETEAYGNVPKYQFKYEKL